jgi:P-type Ca2+ transporter type 2C
MWAMLVNVGLFVWALRDPRGLPYAMTMVFVCVICIEFVRAYSVRSDQAVVFRNPFVNTWLNLSVLFGLTLLIAIMHIPALQWPFRVMPLQSTDWLIAIGVTFTIIPVLEIAKWILRKKRV